MVFPVSVRAIIKEAAKAASSRFLFIRKCTKTPCNLLTAGRKRRILLPTTVETEGEPLGKVLSRGIQDFLTAILFLLCFELLEFGF